MKSLKGSNMENQSNKITPSNALLASLVVASLMTAAACGTKTNPMEDYKDIPVIPEKQITAETIPTPTPYPIPPTPEPNYDEVVTSDVFRISSSGALKFIEGKESAYYFKPSLKLSGVKYEIVAEGLPADLGMEFSKATEPERAGQYKLRWSPKYNTLNKGEPFRDIKFNLVMKVVGKVDAEAEYILSRISLVSEQTISLLRTDKTPVIESVNPSQPVVTEGEATTFEVIVKDLTATEETPVQLYPAKEKGASNESVKINGAPYVLVDSDPQVANGGLFKFKVTFDSARAKLPAGNGPVAARFLLKTISQNPGPDKMVEVRINRKAAPAPAAAEPSSPTVAPEAEKASDTPTVNTPKAPIPARKPSPPSSTGGNK